MNARIDLHILRPSDLPGVEIWQSHLDAGISTGGVFSEYAVAAIRGPCRYWCRGQMGERAGSYVMTVQPGEFYPSHILGPLDARILFIDREVMRRAAEDRGQGGEPYFSMASAEDHDTWRRLTAVTTAVTGSSSPLTQQVAFTELVDVVLSRYVVRRADLSDPVAHRAVRRMRDLIHERYGDQLTLDELATRAGLNKFYALRAFKQAVGVPPNTYQRHVRIAKARELLRTGRDAADVALDLGFCDQSHFVRWFHRLVHVTPRQFQLPCGS